jgi:hypothetical protein
MQFAVRIGATSREKEIFGVVWAGIARGIQSRKAKATYEVLGLGVALSICPLLENRLRSIRIEAKGDFTKENGARQAKWYNH